MHNILHYTQLSNVPSNIAQNHYHYISADVDFISLKTCPALSWALIIQGNLVNCFFMSQPQGSHFTTIIELSRNSVTYFLSFLCPPVFSLCVFLFFCQLLVMFRALICDSFDSDQKQTVFIKKIVGCLFLICHVTCVELLVFYPAEQRVNIALVKFSDPWIRTLPC